MTVIPADVGALTVSLAATRYEDGRRIVSPGWEWSVAADLLAHLRESGWELRQIASRSGE